MQTFTRYSVFTSLLLAALFGFSVTCHSSEVTPQQVLQQYVQSANHGASCCQNNPCPVLEPNASAEEVEKYLGATVQVGSRYNTVGGGWGSTTLTPSTSRGDPVVVTYSFVPDGVTIPAISYHSAGPSNLFGALDKQFGGNRSAWQNLFRRVYADWSAKSGIRYIEVSDDGASWGSPAVNGVRGDIRIYGITIPGSVAAYNYYPGGGSGGDMVVDTSYGWNSPGDDFVLFRNMIGHEHAHGMGLGHVTSSNAVMLMEPVLDWSISGAQDDDIRGMQRQYGDTYERPGSSGSGHNNSMSSATDLGSVSGSKTWSNASIDDGADVDYYKFSIGGSSNVSVTVSPSGRTYSVGNQGSGESTIDTTRIQDLKFDILNSSGTLLRAVNAAGMGGSESTTISLGAGTYYVRVDDVTGATNVQLYSLTINTGASSTPTPTPTPTLTSVTVSPSSASINVGATQQFTATARDQNGNAMSSQPSFTWTVNGGGTISSSGLFTGNSAGTFTVTASGGGKSGTAQVTVKSTTTNTTRSNFASLEIPGTIQAEDFDNGGEGVAYHDGDSANSGGAYRSTGVDISSCSEGGFKVGWMQPGEWTEYTVNVLNSGTYDIEARVSTIYSGKTFHINFNGTNVTGPMTCPNTGDWQRWGSVKVSGVKLTAGKQVMRIAIDSDLFNINLVKFTATSTTPTSGGSGSITPAMIQAEDYRTGGEGVGYHDVTAGNSGGKYRTDGVDIESCSDSGGGYNIGYVSGGEWLAYNISAGTSGNYTVTLRISAAGAGKTLHLEVDNARVGSTVSVPNTGGYQNWTNVVVSGVPISAGSHVFKVVLESNDINFNWLSFGASAVEVAPENAAPVLGSCGANPAQAIAGAIVDFFSSATDPNNDVINFAWDFGDGTFTAGGSAQHVYTAPGVYTATLTADDGKGMWTEETHSVVVGAGSGGEVKPLDVHRLRAGLNFTKPGRDYLLLEATLNVPAEFTAEGTPVVIDCNGTELHAELSAKGIAKLEDASVKLSVARGKGSEGQRKLSVSIHNGEFAQLLLGSAVRDAKNAPLSVKVNVMLGTTTYSATVEGKYSGNSAKTGKIY